jgi:hypothetical protein
MKNFLRSKALKYPYIDIIFCVIGLIMVFIDYLFYKDFMIEGIFIAFLSIVLLMNIARLSYLRHYYPFVLALILNGLIIALLTFSLYIMLILCFGYGITGSTWPPHFLIALCINLVFPVFMFRELLILWRKRK